jgi:hypothetical protein
VFERDPNQMTWTRDGKLGASDGTAGNPNGFGCSVALDPDVAFVGADADDAQGPDNGATYVFVRSGSWPANEQVKRLPSGNADGGRYGCAVAAEAGTTLVGAYKDSENQSWAGAAYVLEPPPYWTEKAKLLAHTDRKGDHFSYSAAATFNFAAIGSPDDAENGASSGSVYVFQKEGPNWDWYCKVLPRSGAAGDEFGFATGLTYPEVPIMAVGAPRCDVGGVDSGVVYMFENSAPDWRQTQELAASDASAYDLFGHAVAIEDNRLVIGAPRDPNQGATGGTAYLFTRDPNGLWSQAKRFDGEDPNASDLFGFSVAISGNVGVIGSPGVDHPGKNDVGACYGFSRGPMGIWLRDTGVAPNDLEAGAWFGYSVAIAGDSVLVGAPLADVDGKTDAGLVVAYTRDPNGTWVEDGRFGSPEPNAYDWFGECVRISGDTAVITASGVDAGGENNAGAAYLYERDSNSLTGWSYYATVLPVGGDPGDYFGSSAAIFGEDVLIGSPWAEHGDPGLDFGLGYAFEAFGEDCNGNGICDSRDIYDGTSLDEDENGIPDECEGPCRGDCNCDGWISFADINAFVDAVVNGIYCDDGSNSDMDEDGIVGFSDINPFVALLTGGGIPMECPNP